MVKCKSNWEVERVISCFVNDDEAVLCHREVVQIDLVLRRSEQIAQLTNLGLERNFVEQLKQIDVRRVTADVLLEEGVNGGFKQKGVVDGDHSNLWLAVPAGCSSSGDTAIHDIIGDEEEGLEELGQPA